MLVQRTVTVTPGTTSADPARAQVDLPRGVLYRVEAVFPWGCFYMVKCRVYYGLEKIFPWHGSEDVAGNGEVIQDILDFDLPDDPTTLSVECYCPDCRYEHSITFRFYVYPHRRILERILYGLARYLGVRM